MAGTGALAVALLLVLAPPAARGFLYGDYYDYDVEDLFTETPTASPDLGEGNIAAGETVDFGYAYAVALVGDGTIEPFCAGVLYEDNIVLTAAHCIVDKKKFHVVTELYDTSAARDAAVQVHQVEHVVKHFLFNPDTYVNDVAVIKLAQPARALNGGLLPTVKLSYDGVEAGTELLALGWGTIAANGPAAGALQKGYVNLAARASCEAEYGAYGFTIDASMTCSESVLTGQAPCSGDAGAPLVVENPDGADVLVGLYSISYPGCTSETVSIYANIQDLSSWIDNITYQLTVN